jgi:folate-binding protein YgfZ
MTQSLIQIPNRALIHITGQDRFAFLQGLISQDIEKLKTHPLIYGAFLTGNGKFLYDFFALETEDTIILDVMHHDENGHDIAAEFAKKLGFYTLRRDVQINYDPAPITIYADMHGHIGIPDPRHTALGNRVYHIKNHDQCDDYALYESVRIKHAIPDGRRDMVAEKATLIESNLHLLNGVDFEKGCYMGQELTARMYHRGLAKKHFYPVMSCDFIEIGADLMDKDHRIGEMRSSYFCASHQKWLGLALLKDEFAQTCKKENGLIELKESR